MARIVKITEVITIDTDSDEDDPAPPLQHPTPVVTKPLHIQSGTVARQPFVDSVRGKNVNHVRPIVRSQQKQHQITGNQPMQQASVSDPAALGNDCVTGNTLHASQPRSTPICEIRGEDGFVYVLSQNRTEPLQDPASTALVTSSPHPGIIQHSQVLTTVPVKAPVTSDHATILVGGQTNCSFAESIRALGPFTAQAKASFGTSGTLSKVSTRSKISGLSNDDIKSLGVSTQHKETASTNKASVLAQAGTQLDQVRADVTAVHIRPQATTESRRPSKVRRVTDVADTLINMSYPQCQSSKPITLPHNFLSDWSNIRTPNVPMTRRMSQTSLPLTRDGAIAVPQVISGSVTASLAQARETVSQSVKPATFSSKKSASKQCTKRLTNSPSEASSPNSKVSSSNVKVTSPSVTIVSPKPTVCGWSSESMESMRVLQEMKNNPLRSLSQPVKQEPQEPPTPSKGTLAIQRFRRHHSSSQPMAIPNMKVEVIDLSDELPDLENDDEPVIIKQEGSAETLEAVFLRTGQSITRCLQSLSMPPRSPRINSAPNKLPNKGCFYQLRGNSMALSMQGVSRTSEQLTASSSQPASTPVVEHGYCAVPSTSQGDVKIGSFNDHNYASADDDSALQSNLNLPIESMDDDTSILERPCQPRITGRRQRCPVTAAPCKVAPSLKASKLPTFQVLLHSSISPNGGAHPKAPPAVIQWNLRKSLLGHRQVVVNKSELLNSRCHNSLKIYFNTNDVHAAHGLEMLTKLTCRVRRPLPWVVTRLMDYVSSRPSLTTAPCGTGDREQGPRMHRLISYLRQLNSSGWLLGSDYELPLWDLLEGEAACLEKEATTVTVSQYEPVKLVLLIIEEDLTMIGQNVGTSIAKTFTVKNFSPDVFFVRLRKIQNWIVGGLLSGAGDPLIAQTLSALSKILALSLCVGKDCESLAMRMAENLCSCFRQLLEPRLRRRLVSLVRPRLVRTLFLSLLLDRMGDTTPVPPNVLQKYVGCKLCLRKVVKFYFRMGGLLVPPSADNDSAAPDNGVVEFLDVLTTLLETYMLLLIDWRNADPAVTTIEHRDFIDRELKRFENIGSLVLALENRHMMSSSAANRIAIGKVFDRLKCLLTIY